MSLSDTSDYGEFVCSDDECEVWSESEPRERYLENKYYPLRIGEVLAGKYRIEHKLGWGGFSTVWMAQDTRENKAVALKIMRPGEEGEREYHIQNHIIRSVRDISSLHITLHQDAFRLPDDAGNW